MVRVPVLTLGVLTACPCSFEVTAFSGCAACMMFFHNMWLSDTEGGMRCRAFMQERLLGANGAELGQAVLYFGCRRADQDYLYGQLLESWAAQGKLTFFTAFSRQQVWLQ